MNTKADTAPAGGALDTLKWLVVAALLAGGVYGNWHFGDESLLYRVLALVGVAVVALLVAATTERGGKFWELLKEARVEIRRVVWPTRQEATQTTLVVMALVILVAFILWLLDLVLGWGVSSVIG